jgi:hypothetical protein
MLVTERGRDRPPHSRPLQPAALLFALAAVCFLALSEAAAFAASDCTDPDLCLQAALDARAREGEQAALRHLDALITAHPQRLRARAERALSLYRLHRMQESIDEIDSLLALELPRNVRANLQALRDEARYRLTSRSTARFGLRAALGHDDNVASFADFDARREGTSTTIGTVGGRPDDYAEAGGRLRLRSVGVGRFNSRFDADLNLRHYARASEFDLQDLRLRGGVEWRPSGLFGMSLAPGVRHLRRAGDALLSDGSLELAAGLSHDPLSMRLGLERAWRRYDRTDFEGLNADHWAGSLRSHLLFGREVQWWVALDLEYREESARNPVQSRDLERATLHAGRSSARQEWSLLLDDSRYRYGGAGQPPFAYLPEFESPVGDVPTPVAVGVDRLIYRSFEARYRYHLDARWSLQLRLRRQLSAIGGIETSLDRTSIDIGIEWNR